MHTAVEKEVTKMLTNVSKVLLVLFSLSALTVVIPRSRNPPSSRDREVSSLTILKIGVTSLPASPLEKFAIVSSLNIEQQPSLLAPATICLRDCRVIDSVSESDRSPILQMQETSAQITPLF